MKSVSQKAFPPGFLSQGYTCLSGMFLSCCTKSGCISSPNGFTSDVGLCCKEVVLLSIPPPSRPQALPLIPELGRCLDYLGKLLTAIQTHGAQFYSNMHQKYNLHLLIFSQMLVSAAKSSALKLYHIEYI